LLSAFCWLRLLPPALSLVLESYSLYFHYRFKDIEQAASNANNKPAESQTEPLFCGLNKISDNVFHRQPTTGCEIFGKSLFKCIN